MSNIFVENANYSSDRKPGLAPLLSLLPGLGQIYNGQARKGLLFLATAISYLSVFLIIVFNQAIVNGLTKFGLAVHMKPDSALVSALYEFRFGSSLSFIVLVLYGAFVIYAMRDAYDQAVFRQSKYIYADCALEINEATSGSYLLHFASISLLFLLAIFFFKHSPAPVQITNIEFVQRQTATDKTVVTKMRSTQKSVNSGVHKPRAVTAAASSNGLVNVPKILKNNAQGELMAKIKPIIPRAVENKVNLPKASNQRMAFVPMPMPNNNGQKSLVAPNMPKMSSSQIDLPKPISAPSRSSSIPVPLSPTGSTTASKQNFIGAHPGPISPTKSDSFVPRPLENAGSSQALTTGSQSLVQPTRGNSFALLPPGTKGIQPVLPPLGTAGAGIPSTQPPLAGNPSQSTSAKDPTSAPSLPVNFAIYMDDLQRRIRRSWFPPKDTESKRIELVFKIHQGGELTDLRILKSCGLAAADEAALKAVQNAAPFRSLPKGAPENIDIQFTFDYSVFGAKSKLFRNY